MTRQEAEKERDRLSEEHPESTWLVRADDAGAWEVVRVNLAQNPSAELTAETRAEERPPTPDDPRPGMLRNIPPYG